MKGGPTSLYSRRSTAMMLRTGSQGDLASVNEIPIDIKFMNARQKLATKSCLSPNTRKENNMLSDTISVLSGRENREIQERTQ